MRSLSLVLILTCGNLAYGSTNRRSVTFRRDLVKCRRHKYAFTEAIFHGYLSELNNLREYDLVKMQEKTTSAVLRVSTDNFYIDSPYFNLMAKYSGQITVAGKKRLPQTVGLVGFNDRLDKVCDDVACIDLSVSTFMPWICVVHSPDPQDLLILKDHASNLIRKPPLIGRSIPTGCFVACLRHRFLQLLRRKPKKNAKIAFKQVDEVKISDTGASTQGQEPKDTASSHSNSDEDISTILSQLIHEDYY